MEKLVNNLFQYYKLPDLDLFMQPSFHHLSLAYVVCFYHIPLAQWYPLIYSNIRGAGDCSTLGSC